MIEIVAALSGALIGVAGLGFFGAMRRNNEGNDAIIKLTVGIEYIGQELQALRVDMKDDRQEIFSRLGSIEQRLSSLEATKDI